MQVKRFLNYAPTVGAAALNVCLSSIVLHLILSRVDHFCPEGVIGLATCAVLFQSCYWEVYCKTKWMRLGMFTFTTVHAIALFARDAAVKFSDGTWETLTVNLLFVALTTAALLLIKSLCDRN
jgi:hypothetical protein